MKIETVACSLYFNAWTLRFYSERSVFRLVSASHFKVSMARCSRSVIFFFKENFRVSKDLVEKIISPVIFDTNRSFKQ